MGDDKNIGNFTYQNAIKIGDLTQKSDKKYHDKNTRSYVKEDKESQEVMDKKLKVAANRVKRAIKQHISGKEFKKITSYTEPDKNKPGGLSA